MISLEGLSDQAFQTPITWCVETLEAFDGGILFKPMSRSLE